MGQWWIERLDPTPIVGPAVGLCVGVGLDRLWGLDYDQERVLGWVQAGVEQ